MKAYRLGVYLKLGLVIAAVLIALASLAFTNHLANRLQAGEEENVALWLDAIEYQYQAAGATINPYQDELLRLSRALSSPQVREALETLADAEAVELNRWLDAVAWARKMPPASELDFVTEKITRNVHFTAPAIITDTLMESAAAHRNISFEKMGAHEDTTAFLLERARDLSRINDPIRLNFQFEGQNVLYQLYQDVYYGESEMVGQLRVWPYVQLLFVGLFVLAGYGGFSYVRRSEQNSLWVGMAKEAAHQLGTPISSIMGWVELLRAQEDPGIERMADELDKDIARLQRVANRFSKIGSRPALEPHALAPVVSNVADYMRRRIPTHGQKVELRVSIPEAIQVPLNVELFEWVVENLIKNALDALERKDGLIELTAREVGNQVQLDVRDTGKGIDKRQWKNVFRPGYSTKKRGWGLGLSLAKRIVEDYHGGSLMLAASKPGEGTTFRMVLQARLAGRRAATPKAPRAVNHTTA